MRPCESSRRITLSSKPEPTKKREREQVLVGCCISNEEQNAEPADTRFKWNHCRSRCAVVITNGSGSGSHLGDWIERRKNDVNCQATQVGRIMLFSPPFFLGGILSRSSWTARSASVQTQNHSEWSPFPGIQESEQTQETPVTVFLPFRSYKQSSDVLLRGRKKIKLKKIARKGTSRNQEKESG